MSLLSDHVNVYSSCIALLDLQGWKIKIEPAPYEKEDSTLDIYVAERNGQIIRAEDPLRLLGLAAIDDYHTPHGEEPYWWVIKGKAPELLERLEDKALEDSFYVFKKENPEECKKHIIKAIEEAKEYPSSQPHERLGVSLESFNKLMEEYPELINAS